MAQVMQNCIPQISDLTILPDPKERGDSRPRLPAYRIFAPDPDGSEPRLIDSHGRKVSAWGARRQDGPPKNETCRYHVKILFR